MNAVNFTFYQVMSERVGFRAGQVVLVPHQGQRLRVQIRSIKVDPVHTWLVYFVERMPYRCRIEHAIPAF